VHVVGRTTWRGFTGPHLLDSFPKDHREPIEKSVQKLLLVVWGASDWTAEYGTTNNPVWSRDVGPHGLVVEIATRALSRNIYIKLRQGIEGKFGKGPQVWKRRKMAWPPQR